MFAHFSMFWYESMFWYVIYVWIFFISQTSNISATLVGNKIVDHSDVVGASAVGDAPTTSSFSI